MEENLWSISIDPDESMREYVLLQLKVRAMRDLLFRSRIFTYLAAATPGLKELVTIGKIWELTQLDRKVKSGRKYDLVIVDAPGDRPRDRLPADAAHLRRDRPGRADPLAGPAAERADHRPGPHRHRDRRPAGGDAGQRVGGARARPSQRGRDRGRPDLPQRPLPRALLEGGGRAPGDAGRRAPTGPSGRPRGRRSPSTAAPAPSGPSWRGCDGGSRPPSRPSPSSSSPTSTSRRRASCRGSSTDARRRPAPRGQGHLHLRRLGRGRQDDDLGRRSRSGWRRAG